MRRTAGKPAIGSDDFGVDHRPGDDPGKRSAQRPTDSSCTEETARAGILVERDRRALRGHYPSGRDGIPEVLSAEADRQHHLRHRIPSRHRHLSRYRIVDRGNSC